MEYIKGVTFKLNYSNNQRFAGEEMKESLRTLKETTSLNTIILAFEALQETPQSEQIDYKSKYTPTDEELKETIAYGKSLGLHIILKPMLNCKNGVWRAHINFFDLEVPCEAKWSKWFESYTAYLLHFSKIAEEMGCEMLMIGCELVQTERKDLYWRKLVADIRECYHGPLTYNTDKYQEGEVKWWDCLDVISSSGYYPQNKWEENLDRIEQVVNQYKKPFFFAECGCMCKIGCNQVPNDWSFEGEENVSVQADYFATMFATCEKRNWIEGFGIWDWGSNYKDYPINNSGYSIYQKPSAEVIKTFYKNKN